ncbi:MAG: hypothetical protein ACO1Q7_03045 [Gemmatimonas sp.]
MGALLRRIRGAIGTGLTWAFVWGAAGGIPRWILGMYSDLPFPVLFAGLGFISGVTFSGIMLLTLRRRRLDQLSMPLLAAAGAVGGLGIGIMFVVTGSSVLTTMLVIPATFALASAASAAGTLALARRAAQLELPPASGGALEANDDHEQIAAFTEPR